MKTPPQIVILASIPAEANLLEVELTQRKEQYIAGKRFVAGTLCDTRVVLTWTGMGKVNAAMVAMLAMHQFQPRIMLTVGIADALNPNLIAGDVLVAEYIMQHDYGELTATGVQPRPTRNSRTNECNPLHIPADTHLLLAAATWCDDQALQAVPEPTPRQPRARVGLLTTGDAFKPLVADRQRLHAQTGADAIDMESAAVAQVCWVYGIRFLAIRGISDTNDAATAQIQQYAAVALTNAFMVVAHTLRNMR